MIIKNLLNIVKAWIFQFVWISLIISFLLFFLNLLAWISYNIHNFSQDIRHKLWVYFYIKDSKDVGEIYQINTEIIRLRETLESQWLTVEYYSKKDALELLEKRLPDVISNFEKYWLDNPLPQTLYVIFDNQEKYQKLREIIPQFSWIIVNLDDVSKGQTFGEQEERVSNVINFTNFVIVFSYFLVVMLIVIICAFLLYVIRINFVYFHKQIEIEKLIWAFYWQIKLPFLFYIGGILLAAFILTAFYVGIFVDSIDTYFQKVFELDLAAYIWQNAGSLFGIYFLQMLVVSWISLTIANVYMNTLIRKV